MSSSIVVNGSTTRRPGVYANVDTSPLGGSQASLGNLALVADLPEFPRAAPQRFNSAKSLEEYDQASDELKLLGYLAFDPTDDQVARGGANTLTVVSPGTTTQALANLLDSAGTNAIEFKSAIYGKRGNRTRIFASKSASKYTFDVVREGITERVEVSPEKIADISYNGTGGVLSEADLKWEALLATYTWTRESAAFAGSQIKIETDWDQCPIEGKVTVSLDDGTGSAHSAAVEVDIYGYDLTGAAVNETVTLAAGDHGPALSVNEYSLISSVNIDTTDGSWVGITSLKGTKTYETDERSVNQVLSDLDAIANVDATSAQPRSSQIKAGEVEPIAVAVDLVSTPVELRADGYFIVEAFAGSKLVEAAQGSFKAPSLATAVTLTFIGGTYTAPADADWQAALDALLTEDVQVVALLSTDASIAQKLPAHCNSAALQGSERNAWAGTSASRTLTQIFDGWTKLLNSESCAVVGDVINVNHPNGTKPDLDPPYFALQLAAMQAGSAVGRALTRLRPRINSASQVWTPNIDADEAISKGVVVLSKDRLGFFVERSITTWLQDDNPILSEVSAWESVQTSVRDLRSTLIGKIGSEVVSGTASILATITRQRLEEQVTLRWIKAFRNIVVEDLGDTIRISYEVAAIEPLNFIQLNVSVNRF